MWSHGGSRGCENPSSSGKWLVGGMPRLGARGVWLPFFPCDVWVDDSLVSCDASQTQSLRCTLSGCSAIPTASPDLTSDSVMPSVWPPLSTRISLQLL